MSAVRDDSTPLLSVVIPVRNDAPALARLLDELVRAGGVAREIIVVDGGSEDTSVEVACRAGATVERTPPGRGRQLAAGCAQARGRLLWLLHADSHDIGRALAYLGQLAERQQLVRCWGRFDVGFEPSSPGLAMVARMMAWRSRLTGICTGDQGMFVGREALAHIGGMPVQPLMEDIELSRRLKQLGRPLCPHIVLTTSSRRWRRDGLMRTIARMWYYRWRYWRGADPELLVRSYYR